MGLKPGPRPSPICCPPPEQHLTQQHTQTAEASRPYPPVTYIHVPHPPVRPAAELSEGAHNVVGTTDPHVTGGTMTTLENRPNTALLVIDVQNGVMGEAYDGTTSSRTSPP